MKRLGLAFLALTFATILFFLPVNVSKEAPPVQETIEKLEEVEPPVGKILELERAPSSPKYDTVQEFLESKDSPLAPHTDYLLEHKHWRLLIAISAIESQYCKRQLGNNCWGIGGDSAYRHYDSIREAITDADALITRWQERGRWLTVEDMNCHYVVPCNPNWVNVVNQVLAQLESYEQSD